MYTTTDVLNNTSKINPIYRSSSVSKNDEHHNHHHHEQLDEESNLSMSNIQITPAEFINMCPALLVQIEQGSCDEEYFEPLKIQARKEIRDITSFGKIFSFIFVELQN